MVVDIGGGTTDIAVLSLNDIATSSSIKIAGDTFDDTIISYMRRRHEILIGANTAEEIKITIGCVVERPEEISMMVKGRDLKTGLPRDAMVTSSEVLEVLRRPARIIVEEILSVLEQSSPELVADIAKNGIILTGGCAQLYGFDALLTERTGIRCTVADDPEACTAIGCGRSLAWINHMHEGPINIARQRAIKSKREF